MIGFVAVGRWGELRLSYDLKKRRKKRESKKKKKKRQPLKSLQPRLQSPPTSSRGVIPLKIP